MCVCVWLCVDKGYCEVIRAGVRAYLCVWVCVSEQLKITHRGGAERWDTDAQASFCK